MVTPLPVTNFSPGRVKAVLPPRSAARSTITEPGRIDAIMSSVIELRRRAAGDERRGDDDVLLGDMRGGQRLLLFLIGRRHFLGIAARGLGLFEFLVLDGDEFGAERFDLLLGRGPHVGRGDDGAEPPRGRNGLQAGDADAHDEGLARRARCPPPSSSSARHGHIRRPHRQRRDSRRDWPGSTARPSPARG